MQASSGGGMAGAPDLWSEPKVFGPRAEFRFVSLSCRERLFFTTTITYLSRVADGGLDAVLVVQRVTKAKDEGELMMMMVMMSVMMVVVMVVMVMLMMMVMVMVRSGIMAARMVGNGRQLSGKDEA